MAKCTFIGLGVMGFPMAGHLAKAGHEVTVFNRNSEKSARWAKEHAGRVAPTVAEAVQDAEFVMMCVGADKDVAEVAALAFPAMTRDAILIDHTTASADIARKLAEEAAGRGLHFIDAPVSGGQAGAENGKLTVMAGGAQAAFDRAAPVIAAYSKAATLIGGPGAGQLCKMVNQICIAGVVQGVAEGLAFAKAADLDPAKVIVAISQGAAQSWQMENRWKTMVAGEFRFGFAVDWMRKDLGIALEEAARNGSALEMTRLVDRFYSEVQAMGGGRWDTSSLIARLGVDPLK
jgi:3-hydroxyisobutyrate dehydrogenase